MAWRKSPQSLIDLFYEVLPDDPRIERRKMFGYPCAFLNGNMFTGLHQENFIVRLSEDDRKHANEQYGTQPFDPMKGRPMREYIALPEEIMADEDALKDWVERSLSFASALPPKEKKPRKAKAKEADKN